MSDLISRAEAKEALRERLKRIPTYAIWAMYTIDELPTRSTSSNTLGALDCVERQKVIDAIEKVHWYHQNDNGEMVRGANSHKHQPWYKSQDVYDALEKLTSVQPRKGKWIYGESEIGHDGYYCSKCGNFVPWEYGEYDIDFIKEFLFCNKCGADMREGDSDDD